jgi:bacillithiol biosynthesis cysteine-adding enzyme BshC
MTAAMEFQYIPAAELPHTTSLYRAFLEDFRSVSEFYSHPPSLAGVAQAAKEVCYPAATRATVVERLRVQNELFGSGPAVARNLDRLGAGAVAVVTGHQLSLFSGPAYTFYKALTAIRLAEELTAAGTPAVPIFWLAGEDHDLAEVNHCFWPSGDGLERFELQSAEVKRGSVGPVRLGDGVVELVSRAAGKLQGPAAEFVGDALRASYTPEQTFASALGRLIARLLGRMGLILLDPVDPELHRLAEPVFLRALDEHAALSEELRNRAAALAQRAFHAQVKVGEQGTLLFWTLDGQRLPVRCVGEKFRVGEREFSGEEIRRAIEKAPIEFSGNVLLRPVVQDTLLPTVAYIAGPAETAYFAQASVVHKHLLGRMPAIVPRASMTIVGPHVARLLEKYKLSVADVFGGSAKLRELMEREALPKALVERFAAGEKTIREALQGLRGPLEKLDKTLLGALEHAEGKMLHQFQALEQKAGRASAFRAGVIETHEKELSTALYPDGQLQERVHCLLPAIASRGLEFLDGLRECIKPGGSNHIVVLG